MENLGGCRESLTGLGFRHTLARIFLNNNRPREIGLGDYDLNVREKYMQYTDLPARVKTAIQSAKPALDDRLDEWIRSPIPALKNRSVIEVLTESGEQGELEIIALCNTIKARF